MDRNLEAVDACFTEKVIEVRKTSHSTHVLLSSRRRVELPPFAYVREGDILEIESSHEKPLIVRKLLRNVDKSGKYHVTILPPYCAMEVIRVPPHEFRVTIRERMSVEDWEQAKRLEQFHYRGQGLNKIVGRRSVLLAVEEHRGTIAYGVVCATVPLAKPRFQLFETNFREQMKTKLINQIVRIPRIVVHPEFRGIGLGALMARHLVEYVRSYWDVNGYAPILVEVIAAMTEYHRFFEAVGFVRIGDTQGYKGRKFRPQYGNGVFESRDNSDRYQFLKDQRAKPYLVYPLIPEIKQRVLQQAGLPDKKPNVVTPTTALKRPIIFQHVSVAYKARNGLTERAAVVKEAFGVDGSQMYGQILKDFFLTIRPGDVVLLTGASGSGKSTVIRLLTETRKQLARVIHLSGQIQGLERFCRSKIVAQLSRQFDDTRPLIDQVGGSPTEAIHLLNGVGLAEAHLYVKRPIQISEGQKYRFAVALLCESKKPIWVADEFASTLDLETAAIVAKGLRKIAWLHGATVILAAAHTNGFVDSLVPNTIVLLSWGDIVEVWSLKMNVDLDDDVLCLSVTNRSQQHIQDVCIGGTDVRGHFHKLIEFPLIGVSETSNTTRLPLRELQPFRALVARSPQKVGDIAYITS